MTDWRIVLAGWLGYLVLPFLAFLMPAGLADRFTGWICRRGWLYRTELDLALANAEPVGAVDDPEAWSAMFRRVRFIDAVDVWHGLFSSTRRLNRLVERDGVWPAETSFIAVGTHVGPGTLVLRMMREAGVTPQFVFRAIPPEWKRQVPALYAYTALRIRYIRRQCAGREIEVPRQRDRVGAAMEADDAALVLLVDAPGHSTHAHAVSLFGHRLITARRGLELAQSKQSRFVFYTLTLDPDTGRRRLELGSPRTFADDAALIAASSDFVTSVVEGAPAQWQLWSTPEQLLEPVRQGDAEPA